MKPSKKIPLLLLAYLWLLLVSCYYNNWAYSPSKPPHYEDDKYIYSFVGVDNVELIDVNNSAVMFNCAMTLSNPCWGAFPEIHGDSNRYYVEMWGMKEKRLMCIQVISTRIIPVQIEVEGPGDYTFCFIRRQGGTIEIDVTMP
ncbi:MAG: hypothetical protein GY855_08305 [candidate division Zixibacteria bacterium]|nr:hypothetical protein [candidate division Zixibacteria bacterium]